MITIYGASDGSLKIESNTGEDLDTLGTFSNKDNGSLLTFSDGTVLRADHPATGIWKIALVEKGTADLLIDPALEDSDSDRAQLESPDIITWVVGKGK